jgi:AcrR family transcriptional regulator
MPMSAARSKRREVRVPPPRAPRPRRTQAERSESTRRLLLDAAVAELIAKGYAGLRTADVVAAAGVSRGALTHHFASKDALVVAVVEDVFRRTSETGRRRALGSGAGTDVIAALIDDSREFFFSELFLVALDLAIQGRLQSASPSRQVMAISAASRLPLEAAWLDALVAHGIAKEHAEDILWLTISIVRGLALRRLWQHDPKRFARLFRVWREMVQAYLGAEAASPAGKPK